MAKISKKALEETVEQYLNIQAQIKALQTEADALKTVLKKEADAAEARSLIVGTHTVSLKTQSRSSINVKEFTEAHPRLAAKFTKVTSYDVLHVR